MKKFFQIMVSIAFLLSGVVSVANAANNTSADGKYSFQLETDGYALPTWYWNGYTFVEGQQGQRYSIRVFNHTAQRVEAVVTIDGRDAITGKTGNYKRNRGYVVAPYGSVLIKGFRTSWNNVAEFYFTDISDSYAARMGSARNVGVIGVAVYEEKTRRRPPVRIHRAPRKRHLGTRYGGSQPPHESEAEVKSYDNEDAASAGEARAARKKGSQMPAPRQNIGTGYGNQEYSPASSTVFRRKTISPTARLSIYYDDRESLMAKGVIPRPRPRPPIHRRPAPDPFPANNDPGFAPPPPTYYWE